MAESGYVPQLQPLSSVNSSGVLTVVDCAGRSLGITSTQNNDGTNSVSLAPTGGGTSVGGRLTAGAAQPTANSWVANEAGGTVRYLESWSVVESASVPSKNPYPQVGQGGCVQFFAAARTSDTLQPSQSNIALGSAAYVTADDANKAAYGFYSSVNRKATATGSQVLGMEIDAAQLGAYTPFNSYSIMFQNQSAAGLVTNLWLVSGGEWSNTTTPINPTSFALGISHNGKSNLAPGAYCQHGKGIVFAADALLGTTGTGTGNACAVQMAVGHELQWIYANAEQASFRIGSQCTTADALQLYARNTGLCVEGVNNGDTLFQVRPQVGAVAANYAFMRAAPTGQPVLLSADGTDTDVSVSLQSKGNGGITVYPGGNAGFVVSGGVASAVNYGYVTPAATGGAVIVGANGTDTNIPLAVRSKGTGTVFVQPGAVTAMSFASVASAVNFYQVTPATTGNAPVLSSIGTDTNIDMYLAPKGTGVVRIGTAATAATVPGNFSAARYLPIKDNTGTTYYLPLATAPW